MLSRVISSLYIFKKVGALQLRARWRAAAVFPIHGTKKRICAPTRNGPTSLFDIIKESHDNGEDAPKPQPPTHCA